MSSYRVRATPYYTEGYHGSITPTDVHAWVAKGPTNDLDWAARRRVLQDQVDDTENETAILRGALKVSAIVAVLMSAATFIVAFTVDWRDYNGLSLGGLMALLFIVTLAASMISMLTLSFDMNDKRVMRRVAVRSLREHDQANQDRLLKPDSP